SVLSYPLQWVLNQAPLYFCDHNLNISYLIHLIYKEDYFSIKGKSLLTSSYSSWISFVLYPKSKGRIDSDETEKSTAVWNGFTIITVTTINAFLPFVFSKLISP